MRAVTPCDIRDSFKHFRRHVFAPAKRSNGRVSKPPLLDWRHCRYNYRSAAWIRGGIVLLRVLECKPHGHLYALDEFQVQSSIVHSTPRLFAKQSVGSNRPWDWPRLVWSTDRRLELLSIVKTEPWKQNSSSGFAKAHRKVLPSTECKTNRCRDKVERGERMGDSMGDRERTLHQVQDLEERESHDQEVSVELWPRHVDGCRDRVSRRHLQCAPVLCV
mmetsp:Transcript_11202/g.23122  ORF Transcript_11202/g.23122 Transcript_11202/m.23122 type:complete len:218 (-) Transcript_11202:162-815(-)